MHESSSSILCSVQQECVPLSRLITMTHYSRGEIASVITSTVTNLLITQQLASETISSSPAVSRRHQTNVVCLRRNSLHSAERPTREKKKCRQHSNRKNTKADGLEYMDERKEFLQHDYVNRSPRRMVSFWSCWEPAPAKSFTVGWGVVESSDSRLQSRGYSWRGRSRSC